MVGFTQKGPIDTPTLVTSYPEFLSLQAPLYNRYVDAVILQGQEPTIEDIVSTFVRNSQFNPNLPANHLWLENLVLRHSFVLCNPALLQT